MSGDGISALMRVTITKKQNANDEALNGADKQRALVAEQKRVRQAQREIDSILRDNVVNQEEHSKLYTMANEFGLDNASANNTDSPTWLYYTGDGPDNIKVGNDPGNDTVNQNEKKMNELKAQFEDISKNLESEDKLGNAEIQDLMSQYNQMESLLSSVLKSKDQAESAPIQKIG